MRLSGAEMVNPTLYEFHNLIVQFSETKVHSLEKDNIDSNRFAVLSGSDETIIFMIFIESSWIGIALDGETRCCGAFPETRLPQVRPTRRLAMSCPHSPARRLYLAFFPRVLSFLSRFHLAFVLYVNSDHAWRPTPRFLDMATPPGRFKSSVRVINVDPISSIHRSFCI